ncbi:MAG TPA: hypothetical protein PLU54_01805, partial [Deltaproteobacteria bacterium]|nr:hypothetical protein [Deltaproteobacteria bacterium]
MGEIESTRLGTGRLYGLHSHIIAILLGSGMVLACILTVIYLSINYVSLVSRFSHENDLRLVKLEKMLSVPVLKQDFVMVVDIIDAEVKGGGLNYIWVVEKGLVIASNDPGQVMHPLDLDYVSRKGFTSITTPDGFSIAIL